jgi:phosphonate transport system substrate-binding protein
MKLFFKIILPLAFSLILSLNAAAADKIYTLAVVPQVPPLEIHKNWTPFLERISKETGISLTLRMYKTIPEFEEDLLKGSPDFAFMNPYHQVMAKKAKGYIPLVRDSKPLEGILVVRKDGPYKKLGDLNGKDLAFPAPNAYAAALYMRALLMEKEKITFTPVYVKTHTNVYRHVILRKAAAGGGVNNTLQRESDDVKSDLRILYKTPGSAPHPLSAHPGAPEKIRSAIVNAILKIAEDPSSRPMLDAIQMPNPVKADYAKDYLPLEKLGLEKYIVKGGD